MFSEICAGLDTGSTVKMHVRQHLRDLVLFGISYGRQGELLHQGRELLPDRHNCAWPEFYVDPDDGVLKDRAWFWRDRGRTLPPRKKDLRWKGLP